MPRRLAPAPPKPQPVTEDERALDAARGALRHWNLETESVEGEALGRLLADHPFVLGIHPLLSAPNRKRVLRPSIVRRALVVTGAESGETFAVALETPGILMPSAPKRKDAMRTHWLVCLPPIPGRPEPDLIRVTSPDVEEILALAIMYRTPPEDEAALAALAPP